MPTGFRSRGLRGPAYVRDLRGPPASRTLRESHAILLVSDGVCPTGDLVRQAVRTARRQRAKLYVLQVLGCADADEAGELRDAFELGEELTAAVLRAGRGRLPASSSVLVHIGGPDTVIDYVTTTIQPSLVIAEQALVHGRSSALPELIGTAQGCPVLLIPTFEEATGELPESIRIADAPRLLN
jgi:hypothetical protein